MLCVLVACVACALSCATAAQSPGIDREATRYRLKIERQPLDTALQEFARQSGIQIIFFSRLTDGLQSSALEGDYTLAAAMDRLLVDSSLTFEVINTQTVEIHPRSADAEDKSRRPESAAAGSPRSRNARRSQNEAGSSRQTAEVVVLGTAEQLVATRIETPLREIPQTVSIVSREQMRQQNDTDLSDVLRHAPGITMLRTNSLDQDFYSRAYQITSFHVDGGAALNPRINSAVLFLGTPDLSEFDHVEVLRGSDALFGGNGNPGGTVSLVRKRLLEIYRAEVNASTGSWENHRAEVDVTGPIAFDGALRGRVDAVYAHRNYFYDVANLDRKKIFAVFDYDFTPAATLTVGGSYQWDNAVPFVNGLPLYKDGNDPRLPRHTALTFDWSRYRTGVREAYLQYRQAFGGDWALKLNASSWRAKVDYGYGAFYSLIDPISQSLDGAPSSIFTGKPNVHTQNTFDATLTGLLHWFGWREEVAVGGDFTRLKARLDLRDYGAFGAPLSDPRAFDPRDYPDPRLTNPPGLGVDGASTLDQYGVFASLRVYFSDAWSVAGGARVGSDSIDTRVALTFGSLRTDPLTARFGNLHVVTPYAGVIYAMNDHYSLYASYADIYLSMGTANRADGSAIGATSGANLEAGIKGAWRDGALNGSLVLYRIAQSHLPLSDPTPRPPDNKVLNCCYVSGTSKSRGADLELAGELAPGWLVGTGYTYNVNEAAAGGGLSTVTPLHLLKLWTSTRLPGDFNRWTVGGGLHAQTKTTTGGSYCPPDAGSCVGFNVVQSPYVVLDLRAGFQLDASWQVALSVNNVLDKDYYESIGAQGLRTWYGEPRGFMLRVDGKY